MHKPVFYHVSWNQLIISKARAALTLLSVVFHTRDHLQSNIDISAMESKLHLKMLMYQMYPSL